MAEVPSELRTFHDTVTPTISSMSSAVATLKTSMSDFTNCCKTTKSGVDTFYKSEKKDTVMNALESIDTCITNLTNGVTNDLDKIVNDSSTLCTKIAELIKKEETIKELQNQALYNEDPGKKASIQSQLFTLNMQFTTELENANEILNNLKNFSGSIPKFKQAAATTTTTDLPEVVAGEADFVTIDVNGTQVRCYLYIPKYAEETNEPIPIMEYMYGMDMNDHGEELATYGGLGKLISDGTVTPKGIVVIPVVQNGMWYESKANRDLLAEIPKKVAELYNGDVNRMSLGGTSYGAVTAYRMVNEHPGEFSAILSAYGGGDITDAFNGVTVYNYTGRGGTNHTDRNYIIKATEDINNVGGYSEIHLYDDTWNHTNVGTRAFSERDEETGELMVDKVLSIKKG